MLDEELGDRVKREALDLAVTITLKALLADSPSGGDVIRRVVEEIIGQILAKLPPDKFSEIYRAAVNEQVEFIFGSDDP